MKNLKKLSGILLAIAVLLACTVSAFAATDNIAKGEITGGTITVGSASNGHTYSAYQLLYIESYDSSAGTYTYKANTAWASWLETQDTILNIDDQGYVTIANSVSPAMLETFAKDALSYAKTDATKINPTKTAIAANDKAEFTDLKLGYYLVDTTVGTLCMLDTTKPAMTATEKNYLPTVTKEVKDTLASEPSDKNVASIGDTVYFVTTINARKGAQNYTLHDKMDAGLTLNQNSFKVQVLGADVDTGDYTIKKADCADECDFEITFTQGYLDRISTDTAIVVTYNAYLNSNAVTGTAGNKNTTWLNYSENNSTTKTIDATTTTYTYERDVVKTDDKAEKNVIKGAEFKLYKDRDKAEEIKLVEIKNSSNEVIAYRPATADEKAAGGLVVETIKIGNTTIKGLQTGKYYLDETKAPNGYNRLSAVAEFEIRSENDNATINENKLVKGGLQIKNSAGALLPSTGGIGTTIFYIVGGVLVAAAVVLLVAKKRTSENR